MVDVPKLRERVIQAKGGCLSAYFTGNCLAAALDEIEELRAEKARVQSVYDQMDGDAEEADHEIKELRAERDEWKRKADLHIRALVAYKEGKDAKEERLIEGNRLLAAALLEMALSVRSAHRPEQTVFDHERMWRAIEMAESLLQPVMHRTKEPAPCPDCGIGPCAEDPTAVTAATPRCFQRGYCGEPGEMSRPRVDCLINGNRMGLWDELHLRLTETK